eukprot:5825566-Amphidinium_carterae.1
MHTYMYTFLGICLGSVSDSRVCEIAVAATILVIVEVNPVLYGVAYCPDVGQMWQDFVSRVVDMCFGVTRFLASKPLVAMVAYKAHGWNPNLFRFSESMSVLHRLGRFAETRILLDSMAQLGTQMEKLKIPLWVNMFEWFHSCSASLVQGGVVQVQGIPWLDFAMASAEWKHSVRELMRVKAYMDACAKQRGLLLDNAVALDTFLLHHVLIKS